MVTETAKNETRTSTGQTIAISGSLLLVFALATSAPFFGSAVSREVECYGDDFKIAVSHPVFRIKMTVSGIDGNNIETYTGSSHSTDDNKVLQYASTSCEKNKRPTATGMHEVFTPIPLD